MEKSKIKTYWFLVFPSVFILLALTIYPSLYAMVVSLFNWNLLSSQKLFIGLGNYFNIIKSALFWVAVKNTSLFIVYSVGTQLLIGLILALGFNRLGRKGSILAVLFVMPMMIPEVVGAVTWQLLYNPAYGPISQILRQFGIYNIPVLLADQSTALLAVAAVDIWRNTSFVVLVLLAGLRAISIDYYENAAIEGAKPWQVFKYITLPFLKPFLIMVLLFRGADAFKVFDPIYVLTRGGPGNATETLSYHMFRQGFGFFEIGYASALSLIMIFVAVWFSNGIVKISHSRENIP